MEGLPVIANHPNSAVEQRDYHVSTKGCTIHLVGNWQWPLTGALHDEM
jgi:hypothetical protein